MTSRGQAKDDHRCYQGRYLERPSRCRPDERRRERFSNDKAGHSALIDWLGVPDARIIYEPTGSRVGDKEIDVEITRERFENMAAQLLSRMSRPLDRALSDAGLSAEQISHLVLVGGATRMPVVRSLAARRTRRLPATGIDPDQVVALGAAVQPAPIANNQALEDVVMTDFSAFTLGIEITHSTESGSFHGYFTPIIKRNSVVPVSREMTFSTGEFGQRTVEIKVLQGETPVAQNNLLLGSCRCWFR